MKKNKGKSLKRFSNDESPKVKKTDHVQVLSRLCLFSLYKQDG